MITSIHFAKQPYEFVFKSKWAAFVRKEKREIFSSRWWNEKLHWIYPIIIQFEAVGFTSELNMRKAIIAMHTPGTLVIISAFGLATKCQTIRLYICPNIATLLSRNVLCT